MLVTCSILSVAGIIGASYYKWKNQTENEKTTDSPSNELFLDGEGFEKRDPKQQQLIIESQEKYKKTLDELKTKWNCKDGLQLKKNNHDDSFKKTQQSTIHDMVKCEITRKFKNHIEENNIETQESEIEF